MGRFASSVRCLSSELFRIGRPRSNGTSFARQVGAALAGIHAKSAGEGSLRTIFATDHLFFALRIEPYLLATAKKHPDLASHIELIAERTLQTKTALVHGDVSPKNILIGESGPVFLDAETAWFGDPAFDLAFCLNHLLLKSIHKPRSAEGYMRCFGELAGEYLSRISWESSDDLNSRAAALLPILHLARVDGKSPVEYLVTAEEKETVRERAKAIIARRTSDILQIEKDWTG
jgi:aminoglycoside phosphotransferase (APT) family kinase protein